MPPALLLLLFEWFFLKHAYAEIHELVMFAICYLCCMLTKVQRAPMNVCTPAWLLRCFFFLFRNNKQGGGGGHAFPISTVKMRLFEGKPASGLRKEGISLGWGRKIKTQRNLDQVQVERRGFFRVQFLFHFILLTASRLYLINFGNWLEAVKFHELVSGWFKGIERIWWH